MLQVDLSTLNGPELRRLLDTTRERGQAALTYQILQEMAARRERVARGGPRALLPGRRPAEPRMIDVELGDPLDDPDDDIPPMPSWRPPLLGPEAAGARRSPEPAAPAAPAPK